MDPTRRKILKTGAGAAAMAAAAAKGFAQQSGTKRSRTLLREGPGSHPL